MNIFKIVLICLVTNLLINTVQAMEIKKDALTSTPAACFPDEIFVRILGYSGLDVCLQFLSVSKFFNNNAQAKFMLIAKETFDDEAEIFTKGKIFKKQLCLAAKILNMEKWHQAQLNQVIEAENYSWIEKILIKNLEKQILKESLGLAIKTNKEMASFLFAHYLVNLDASRQAASKIAENVAFRSPDNYYAPNVVRNAAESFRLMAIRNEAFRSSQTHAHNSSWNRACFITDFAVKKTTTRATRIISKVTANSVNHDITMGANSEAVIKALNKIKSAACQKNGEDAWRLSNLYFLSHMIQNKYREEYFIKVYDVVKNSLDGKEIFKLSIDEIINIYAEKTWLSDSHKYNPHIVSLSRIAKTIYQDLKQNELDNCQRQD